ncbi:MAG: DUF494 family protein [Ignavibacteriaceae bacterium]
MISEIVNVLEEIVLGMSRTSSLDEVIKIINKGKKYNKSVVAAAYSWVYEKLVREVRNDLTFGISSGVRILSEDETLLIGPENYNYLLHFINIGLLNHNDMNLIIEKIKLFPDEQITVDNINLLILSLFLDADSLALPGSRILLNSSDQIN